MLYKIRTGDGKYGGWLIIFFSSGDLSFTLGWKSQTRVRQESDRSSEMDRCNFSKYEAQE